MSTTPGGELTEREIIAEGRQYAAENNLDDADEEALGAAVYLEEISSGDRRDYTLEDLSEYIATSDDFNYGEFIEFKAGMANDYSVFADEMSDFLDDFQHQFNRAEANSAMYQALYEQVKNERDSALQAIRQMGEDASDIDTDLDVPAPEPGDDPDYPAAPDTPEGDTGDDPSIGGWNVRAESHVDSNISVNVSIGGDGEDDVSVNIDDSDTDQASSSEASAEAHVDESVDIDEDWHHDDDFFDPDDYDVPFE